MKQNLRKSERPGIKGTSVAEMCFKSLTYIIGEAFKNNVYGMIGEAEAAGRLGGCFYNIDGLAADFFRNILS